MFVTRQSLRSAALCQDGPGLCVDIPATHKWPVIGNPRSVDAKTFDSVSTGSSLALTVAMSYHTNCTCRLTSSLALTNFSGVLVLGDRASSEKTSGRRAWAEKTSCSLLRATTMIMIRACQHLQKRTSSSPRQPTGAILDLSRLCSVRMAEMKIVRHLQTQASSFNVTRDCQMSPNSRGVALPTEVQLY